MVKVRRLSDGAKGWALRMALPFRLDGAVHAGGTWVAELREYRGWSEGVRARRLAVTDADMRSRYAVTGAFAGKVLQ